MQLQTDGTWATWPRLHHERPGNRTDWTNTQEAKLKCSHSQENRNKHIEKQRDKENVHKMKRERQKKSVNLLEDEGPD